MAGLEPKKLALLRILQILEKYSDCDHPLTQEDILRYLDKEYGIVIERKAVGRNISLLREAGYDIESGRTGCYLASRTFDDSELRLLIDSVLGSRHIPAKQSKDLIERLCATSNVYFKRHIKNIHTVNDWSKTGNKELFYNISVIDEAIEHGKMVRYHYNRYGADKKLHRTAYQRVCPYQLILHNQRYYLMGYNPYYEHIVFHRLDRITGIGESNRDSIPLRTIKGYENGIDYSKISTLPYMYSDEPERITFYADEQGVDQIIDWLGDGVSFTREGDRLVASVVSSPTAMTLWAVQYADFVEIISPVHVRESVKEFLEKGLEKYKD